MSTEMLMKNRERFIKNVNSNENGAAALSLRLFCYARSMAVKNPYAETHDWIYENELTSAQANQYVFRLLDGSTERPSMDMLIRKLKSVRLVRDSEMNGRKINRHSPYLSITLHKCYPYYLFGISTFPNSAYHSIALRKFSITIV